MLSNKLIQAAANGNVRDVKKLLSRGALFTKDKEGSTALHEASRNGHTDVVTQLMKANCFPDTYNSHGSIPLHLASQHGHAPVVKVLLKYKSNPALADNNGETGLHIAAKYSHPEVIAAYAGTKADMNVVMENGDTAVHVAAKYGNLAALRVLLVGGADPFIRNKDGWLPLETAENCGHSEARLLLECIMQEKSKLYRPHSPQKHYKPNETCSQIDLTSSEGTKKSKSKFSGFKSFLRLRRFSSPGSQSLNSEFTFIQSDQKYKEDIDTSIQSINEDEKPADTPATQERRRSLQLNRSERTYESVDDVIKETTPPIPKLNARRESKDDYVTMGPGISPPEKSNRRKSPDMKNRKSILQPPSYRHSVSSEFDIQEELDMMKRAFAIRLHQLEKKCQRKMQKMELQPVPSSNLPPRPRLPTWGGTATDLHPWQVPTMMPRSLSHYHGNKGPTGLMSASTLCLSASNSKSTRPYKRCGSSDLLSQNEDNTCSSSKPPGHQLQPKAFFQSANLLSETVKSQPDGPLRLLSNSSCGSSVMIDDIDLLSSDDDDESLIESLLDANIGQGSSELDGKPWFTSESKDEGPESNFQRNSLNASFSSVNNRSSFRAQSLLSWIPRNEAKAKLKEKLKSHKLKAINKYQEKIAQLQLSVREEMDLGPQNTVKQHVLKHGSSSSEGSASARQDGYLHSRNSQSQEEVARQLSSSSGHWRCSDSSKQTVV